MRQFWAFCVSCLMAPWLLAAVPVDPPVTEYRMEVSLDPVAKTLTGHEHLLWRNPSSDAVPELRFHLYLNAFKNNRSTFMRESGGHLRQDRAGTKAIDWGYEDVRTMTTDAGVNLKPGFAFLHPDSPDPEDETVLDVKLPRPVPPHGSIGLNIDWVSKLPKVFARTGFVRDFFLAGQWFPKIAVYEPAGMRHRKVGGWNCHQFHANSEFFADYGTYDVNIDVPAKFVVGATGVRESSSTKGGRTTYHYHAENVIDFAWTADPRYKVHEFDFEPDRDIPAGWQEDIAKTLGMPPAEIALHPVQIRILMQPDHDCQWKRYAEAINYALSYYGLHYGPYPFPNLTIVDPPEDGGGAGGMEYPTFITAGTSRIFQHWPLNKIRLPEDVTIHEFGHQYWYFMVGTNEFEESWMDEGINSFSEERCTDRAYHWAMVDLPGKYRFSDLAIDRAGYLFSAGIDPIERFAWKYWGGGSYGVNSYMKPATILRQMEDDLGRATFDRCLRAYFQQWSFRHPDTLDFFDTFERVSGRDLSVYKNDVFFGTRTFDIGVESASTEKEPSDKGVFDRGGKRVTLPEQLKAAKKKEKQPGAYRSIIVIGREGQMPHGADVLFTFEDGKTLTEHFPPDVNWVRYRIHYRKALQSVQVDPQLRNTWDKDLLNNSWVHHENNLAVHKLEWAFEYVGARLLQVFWALA